MKAVKRLTVAGGKYVKDGVEKTRWVDVGTLFQRDDGKYTILINAGINLAAYISKDANSTDIWVNLFDIERNKTAPKAQQSAPQSSVDDIPEEDIPF